MSVCFGAEIIYGCPISSEKAQKILEEKPQWEEFVHVVDAYDLNTNYIVGFKIRGIDAGHYTELTTFDFDKDFFKEEVFSFFKYLNINPIGMGYWLIASVT